MYISSLQSYPSALRLITFPSISVGCQCRAEWHMWRAGEVDEQTVHCIFASWFIVQSSLGRSPPHVAPVHNGALQFVHQLIHCYTVTVCSLTVRLMQSRAVVEPKLSLLTQPCLLSSHLEHNWFGGRSRSFWWSMSPPHTAWVPNVPMFGQADILLHKTCCVYKIQMRTLWPRFL